MKKIKRLRENGVRVSFAVGGDTSDYNSRLRSAIDKDVYTLAKNMVKIMKDYGFNGVAIDFQYDSSTRAKDSARLAKLVRALYDKLDTYYYDIIVTVTGETFLCDSSATSETKDLLDVLNRKASYVIARTYGYDTSLASQKAFGINSNIDKFKNTISKYRNYISKSKLIGSLPYTNYCYNFSSYAYFTCNVYGVGHSGWIKSAVTKDSYRHIYRELCNANLSGSRYANGAPTRNHYALLKTRSSSAPVVGQFIDIYVPFSKNKYAHTKSYITDTLDNIKEKFSPDYTHCGGAASIYVDDDVEYPTLIFYVGAVVKGYSYSNPTIKNRLSILFNSNLKKTTSLIEHNSILYE